MPLTAAELNRATLARQLLLRREPIDAADAVRRVVALQAQEPASPYLGLWNRIERFDGATLDQAFADRTVVKASVVRITLHAVVADDYPAFYAAMLPYLRASRLNDDRFTSEGLTAADADALVPGLLELLAEPRGKAEVEAFCGPPRMWWALRTFAPLLHAPTGPPWSFGPRPRYVASGVPIEADVDAGRATLVKRYLDGFGPASAADIGMFTMLRKPPVQQALADLGDQLVRLEGPDGVELFDVPDGPIPAGTDEGPAPTARHVGQRAARLRRPHAGAARRVPPARHPAQRRRPAHGARRRPGRRGVALLRRRGRGRRVPCAVRRRPGGPSPQKRAAWPPSSPRATPTSTAATTTGGTISPTPRSAAWPASRRPRRRGRRGLPLVKGPRSRRRLPQRTSPGSWLACCTQEASWASSSSSSSWMSR